MKTTTSRKILSLELIVLLVSQLFFLPSMVQAQVKKVSVTVGQPNIWSLEQAHYLLAQIRERNLGLRNPPLKPDDLDPNATNATRLDVLRTIFEMGVNFSQDIGINNGIARNNQALSQKNQAFSQQNLELNQARQQELVIRRSSLFNQKNELLTEKSRLISEKESLVGNGAKEEELKPKDAAIRANQSEIDATDAQINNIETELAKLSLNNTAGPTTLSGTTASNAGAMDKSLSERLGQAMLTEAQKSAAANTRLAASLKVDNYVQMQYELLAKQLTLLRDEVGPNERLIFLELPTSIYATPKVGEDRSARAVWRVEGYDRENRFSGKLNALNIEKTELENQFNQNIAGKTPEQVENLKSKYSRDVREVNEAITRLNQDFREERLDAIRRGGSYYSSINDTGAPVSFNTESVLLGAGDFANAENFVKRLRAEATAASTSKTRLLSIDLWNNHLAPGERAAMMIPWNPQTSPKVLENALNRIMGAGSIYNAPNFDGIALSDETKDLRVRDAAAVPLAGNDLIRFNRFLLEDAYPDQIRRISRNTARTIDMIPRQSSLNLIDTRETVREIGINYVVSLVMGLGFSGNYKRQREKFEQFQQQEVYAAGFGKGESQFGWTFNPMPGTRRLAPGIRTTFAVMVVPRDAVRLHLRAEGQDFRTNSTPPTAFINAEDTTTTSFTLDIPGAGDEGFFVDRIDYQPVKVDERSVAVLQGNFSNQTGVLVNGTSLTRTTGVASPWLGSEREKDNLFKDLGEPDSQVRGYYEVINSNEIIMVFLMPKGFKGTPQITLVSPGRARMINDLPLNINGENKRQKLAEFNGNFLIGRTAPANTPLKIDSAQFSPEKPAVKAVTADGKTEFKATTTTDCGAADQSVTKVSALVSLKVSGLKDGGGKVFFNAEEQSPPPTLLAQSLYNFKVCLPLDQEKISFTVVQDKDLDIKEFDNPVYAKVAVSKIDYDIGDETTEVDDTATIVIEGKRISDMMVSCTGCSPRFTSKSFNQGLIYVWGLEKMITLTITDTLTGEQLPPVIFSRKPVKKPKPDPRDGNKQDNERSK
jgi:hypothetical protein